MRHGQPIQAAPLGIHVIADFPRFGPREAVQFAVAAQWNLVLKTGGLQPTAEKPTSWKPIARGVGE